MNAAQKLIEEGAEAIVLGCTEIPLVLKQKDFGVKLYDPMELTAKEIVHYVREESKDSFVGVDFVLQDFAKDLGRKFEGDKLVEVASY